MKLASLEGRPRRPAGRGLARPHPLHRCVGRCADAAGRAGRLGRMSRPRLADLADALEAEPDRRTCRSSERRCASPLPRAYQWADGSAYVNHVELVRQGARRGDAGSFWTDPLMYQGGSDSFIGAARSDRACRTKPGASTWRPKSPSSSATCRWARPANRRRRRSGWSCWSTMSACAT